jgi:predicted ATP-grasp superfamily ATP-dependent carboligase
MHLTTTSSLRLQQKAKDMRKQVQQLRQQTQGTQVVTK